MNAKLIGDLSDAEAVEAQLKALPTLKKDQLVAVAAELELSEGGMSATKAALVTAITAEIRKRAGEAKPAARKSTSEGGTHCELCGYKFPSRRSPARCRSEVACKARKSGEKPVAARKNSGARKNGGASAEQKAAQKDAKKSAAAERVALVKAAEAEQQAVRQAAKDGKPTPPTPNLDKLQAAKPQRPNRAERQAELRAS